MKIVASINTFSHTFTTRSMNTSFSFRVMALTIALITPLASSHAQASNSVTREIETLFTSMVEALRKEPASVARF